MTTLKVYIGGVWVDVVPGTQVALYTQPTPPADTTALWADTSTAGSFGINVFTTTQRNALSGVNLYRGRTIFNSDTGALEVYYGPTTLWRPPWNTQWGLLNSIVSTNGPTVLLGAVIGGMTFSVTVPANRRLKTSVVGYGGNQTGGSYAEIAIRENSVIVSRFIIGRASGNSSWHFNTPAIRTPAAGTYTYDAIVNGDCTNYIFYSDASQYPMTLFCEDIGPNGSAPAA